MKEFNQEVGGSIPPLGTKGIIMPLMHCKDCHHEWESIDEKKPCDWCSAEGYVLEEKISLEKMLDELRKEANHRKLLRDLGIDVPLPPTTEQSYVEKPAWSSGGTADTRDLKSLGR